MTLSKLEIQQMLREMNVKFNAQETYEELKQRLQHENHSRWLRSVSDHPVAGDGRQRKLIRKRKKVVATDIPATDRPEASEMPERSTSPSTKTPADYHRAPELAYQPRPVDPPSPGKPWKAVADGTQPFNRKKRVFDSVLRRAKMCCEHCGIKSGLPTDEGGLTPYHLLPIANGGEHSIKNVVALCPTCLAAMENNPDPKAIKVLKRQTRSKLYDALQVTKKKTVRGRRRSHHRRK